MAFIVLLRGQSWWADRAVWRCAAVQRRTRIPQLARHPSVRGLGAPSFTSRANPPCTELRSKGSAATPPPQPLLRERQRRAARPPTLHVPTRRDHGCPRPNTRNKGWGGLLLPFPRFRLFMSPMAPAEGEGGIPSP
jgi:hypothetical protein